MPERGAAWESFIVRKFGGVENRDAAFQQVINAGALEGIAFDFVKMPVAPNTVNAHRLVLLAAQQELGKQASEALFKAYFTDARDITDPDTLEEIGAALGLADVRTTLRSDAFKLEVSDAQLEAERLGVSGVPFFVFDRKYALSGAQPVELFRRAIETALSSAADPIPA